MNNSAVAKQLTETSAELGVHHGRAPLILLPSKKEVIAPPSEQTLISPDKNLEFWLKKDWGNKRWVIETMCRDCQKASDLLTRRDRGELSTQEAKNFDTIMTDLSQNVGEGRSEFYNTSADMCEHCSNRGCQKTLFDNHPPAYVLIKPLVDIQPN